MGGCCMGKREVPNLIQRCGASFLKMGVGGQKVTAVGRRRQTC